MPDSITQPVFGLLSAKLPTLPTLEPRLQAVCDLIRAEKHADIGTDHAYLPLHLLRSGRVQHCIATEKTPGPYQKALESIRRAGLEQVGMQNALELRLGNGLVPLEPREVSSISITGMGSKTILSILEGSPAQLLALEHLVLQPNDSALPLRIWAKQAGFWVTEECLPRGFWSYPVIKLERNPAPDPAYLGLPEEIALYCGPLLLRRHDPELLANLEFQKRRLEPLLDTKNASVKQEWAWVMAALEM
jgi:tRNA (adenine22-N1)-methyltransferase